MNFFLGFDDGFLIAFIDDIDFKEKMDKVVEKEIEEGGQEDIGYGADEEDGEQGQLCLENSVRYGSP